ncbi:MAG: YicC family protein [Desulfomicrobium sp.]|nr:YicC family protein [Pseudomonadota bacterium]MBV1712145.1 YicC family protein [Desulfomicrobium sp.]MBU4572783.1 YicC family protein [Pseudomonadota bacterium]MBU4594778.1 YicC family protein [Pseudomonadota bacterium]MBV1718583.1 YicC family protein [Desulfomicrobium sp.]
MPKSMTGYGRTSAQEEGWTLSWEIRSLNNRHLDLKWKIPPTLYAHQKEWENEVRGVANRGGVELFLGLKIHNPELQSLTLDRTMAASMLQELELLASSTGIAYSPDLSRLLNIPSLWKDSGSIDNPQLVASLTEALQRALKDWDESRTREGLALEEDLRVRFARLTELVEEIRVLAAQTAPERFALLQERVGKLLADSGVQVDPDRMLQELAVISDRIDVSEELTRLEIHLKGIDGYFNQTEPVGRKLDFMVQECFREINTCGNKSQNTNISQLVVAFKSDLEKCREQIQNLE